MDSKRKISRREILSSGGILFAGMMFNALPLRKVFAIRGSGQGLAQAGRVVSVIRSSDPNFSAQLDALFPGLSQDPTFQTIAPLSVLITNSSGPKVKALSST